MSRRDTDRNLLFGINALQNDFVTRDALIAAMAAWALEKHRPIGEILVEREALGADDRALLEQLLDRHLARHGNDPMASLAAISSIGSVADALRRSVADPEILESLATIAPVRTMDLYATRDFVPPHPPSPGARFRKLREHAAGNLGVVYVARDEELNREVALKEIKERNADHRQSQAKFLLEAEVTGGLEHPGIVPVYGLGHHVDGRPYYAMRFIRGKSLLDAVRRFHADDSRKVDPGRRLLELQKLLRRFTDVCNAVAYAHSRGVLHRDLKPDNVMVGKYGETLVVDWGLAKALGCPGGSGPADDPEDPLPESSLQPSSTEGLDATQAGSLVGTPAYMSPEQAAGRLDLLGPASDVYGLGATLYHLIVGRPPLEGLPLADVLERVRAGDIPRPRSLAPWLDPALEAICLKAMSPRPGARYDSARTLADDLDRWIAGEPVAAYPEPLARRARRWARKHRTSLATSATAATVAAVLLGGFAWQRLDQLRKVDASAMAALHRADRLAGEARSGEDLARWVEAVTEARRAVDQLESGGGSASLLLDARSRLEALRAEQSGRRDDSRMVSLLDEARLRGANIRDGRFDHETRVGAYLAAFRAYGIDLQALPVEETARRVRSSRIADHLISALDDWERYQPTNAPGPRPVSIARAADTDPARRVIRDLSARGDVAGLRRLSETPEDRRTLGPRLRSVFRSLRGLDPEGSFPQLEAVVREHPSDFWLNHDLGRAYLDAKPPRVQEAVRFLSVAVALRPGSAGARLDLGAALSDSGKIDQAIGEYREAIRLQPEDAIAHYNVGIALDSRKKTDDAIGEYREAIRLRPGYASAHINLGIALVARGKLDLAIESFREALRLRPDAESYGNLGAALRDRGRADESIEACRQAIHLKPDYADAYYNLGLALNDRMSLDEAIDAYRHAIRLEPGYAKAHYNLGVALGQQGKSDQSMAAYREAILLRPDMAEAHYNLGISLYKAGELDQAIGEYRAAILHKPDHASAFVNLGLALRLQRKYGDAIEACRRAIRLKPDDANAHFHLGVALQEQNQFDEAIDSYRQATRFAPGDALAYINLGEILKIQGKLDQAIDIYRQAIGIAPDMGEAHCALGVSLGRKGLFKESLACLERGHELGSRRPGWSYPSAEWVRNARRLAELEASLPAILKGETRPKDATNRVELAVVCFKKGLLVASVRFYEEAFAEQPGLAANLDDGRRYEAVRAAALAGTGAGRDETPPDEASKTRLREKAREWLRAELEALAEVFEGGGALGPSRVAPALARRQAEPDLAGIRDEAALAKLPEAEREAFRSLWSDVEALRKKAAVGGR